MRTCVDASPNAQYAEAWCPTPARPSVRALKALSADESETAVTTRDTLIAWPRSTVHISFNMLTIRSIGFLGVKRHSQKHVQRTNQFFCQWVTALVIGKPFLWFRW
ncbi:hypothetical protein GOP47_0022921 [Adiantum capillus-veneris]|uniref:Uncharacterized protein n=1 Tax=Adiantum capillus-veneris TaxID=13818 RepID=A0A9D4U7E7_ADICA|nr:hypothetical protein GOP47_0022921 [Adiantum capillus-veneris]